MNYPITNEELLSIVDILLEYKNILYGIKNYMYSDYKNLTYNNTNQTSPHVQCQYLLLNEFGYTIVHIPGKKQFS